MALIPGIMYPVAATSWVGVADKIVEGVWDEATPLVKLHVLVTSWDQGQNMMTTSFEREAACFVLEGLGGGLG